MDAEVVIVGAGPTGLMLAGDLAEAGVRTILLERESGPATHPRAWGLQPRTQETLALRGVLDRIADGTKRMSGTTFGGIGLDYGPLDTPFPYFLHAPQTRTEQVLRDRAERAGAEIRYGVAVGTIAADAREVRMETKEGRLSAAYLVGCDGGRSEVRAGAGIELVGTDATSTALFADVELADPADAFALRGARSEEGMILVLRRPPTQFRVIALEFRAPGEQDRPEASEADLRAALSRIAGRDAAFSSVAWISRFTDAARVARSYRNGRVLLAGDAAHVHSPFAGQGLNLGIQDAANLSWRLVRAVLDGEDDLDGYEAERKPVAERVLANTRAQSQLFAAGPGDPLVDAFARLASVPEAGKVLAEEVSGLDIRYQESEDDPLIGSFLPARLRADGGLERIGRSLAAGRPIGVPGAEAELLVRPDGYLAGSGRKG